MIQPWNLVENASRAVQLRLDKIDLKTDRKPSILAYCYIVDIDSGAICDRYDWQLRRSILVDSLPLTVPFTPYKNLSHKTLLEHITDQVADAVSELIGTLQFVMTPAGWAGNYPDPRFFNFRITCVQHPNVKIVHEEPHSDFYVHWKKFFEPNDPLVVEISKAYDDYYAEQKRQRA